MKRQLLFFCVSVCVVSHAMHVHSKPKEDFEDNELGYVEKTEKPTTDVDKIPIDVIRNIPPTRLVPINCERFYINYPPCEEGFERDFLGVCREVFD